MFKKTEQIIFIVSFFLIIFLPLVFVNKKEGAVSIAENRTLAKPAKLYNENGTFNEGYVKDTENWFNDNLGFRDMFVNMNGNIKYYVFNQLPGMPLGPNGELAPFSSFEDYQHTNVVTPDELEQITDAYRTIYDYLNSLGIQMYYVQCWDKNTIYPEQYDDTIQIMNEFSICEQVENDLINKTDIDVIPLKDILIEKKQEYNVYGTWAEAWHWVDRGAFIAYTELINEINRKNDNRYKILTENDFDITKEDIGCTFFGNIHKSDVEEVFTLKNPAAVEMPEKLAYIPPKSTKSQATYYINNSVQNDTVLMVIGDSYFYDYKVNSNLAESFHETVVLQGFITEKNGMIHLIDTYHPDIVVFENAERCNGIYEIAVKMASYLKKPQYELGSEILFCMDEEKEKSKANGYIIKGMSTSEDEFTWTEGKEVSLFFYGKDFNKEMYHFCMDLAGVYCSEQIVKIYINEEEVYFSEVKEGENIEFDFKKAEKDMYSIRIEIPNAVSPLTLGLSDDQRELALKIKSMTIN